MKTEQLGIVTSVRNDSGGLVSAHTFVDVNGYPFNSSEETNVKLGVCIADTNHDDMSPICINGIVIVKTGGAINKGSHVSCDGPIYQLNYTDPKTTQELNSCVGMALDAATAADELIRVLIK
jgi:Uncharacterized conserved protein (DUF2190)